jgi:flagellar biosynthesis/type III secretory pathway M-ring protein FliF/YscJ
MPEQTPAAEKGAAQEKLQSVTNYEYTRTTEHVVLPPGSVKRVSASVAINSSVLTELVDTSDGATTLEDLKKQIDTAVKSAIGHSVKRKDKVEISFVPFAAPLSTQALVQTSVDWKAYLWPIVAMTAIFLIVFFAIRPIVMSITNAIEDTTGKARLDDLSPDELEAMQAAGLDPQTALERKLRRMVGNFEAIDAKDLNRLIHENGQPSAEVLRRWLKVQ